ncbi:MAG: hypothetical protein Q8Q59_16220, partial [Luteolibacter sp.]|nr:hypothetical protein [Luteolibacter sp.]
MATLGSGMALLGKPPKTDSFRSRRSLAIKFSVVTSESRSVVFRPLLLSVSSGMVLMNSLMLSESLPWGLQTKAVNPRSLSAGMLR